ncbi:MAG: hypothetical protein LPK25_14690 [Cyclobacteriaceae bacterium]|mgnify:CR=1 FL=1|nr:hypothetical protein [Cyclobacteriaceae bacterium]MDX5467718.1 hypothetical protein [Cyclobacteriaceae bacterium]
MMYKLLFTLLLPVISIFSPQNQLDDRLIGTWIMVKCEKDSLPFEDDSIQNEFTYTYAKNGDYIFDIRLVRKMVQESKMSVVDFPRFKWQTFEGKIQVKPLFVSPNPASNAVHEVDYEFRKDTLVTSIRNFKRYFLKKK